jgi:integrase
MPRKKPKSWKVGRLTLRLLEGTARKGRWRVEWYPERGKGKQRTRALGWMTKSQAEKAAGALLAAGLPTDKPTATTAGPIRVVRDVLEVYNGALHARADLSAQTRRAVEDSLKRLQRVVGELPVGLLGKSIATTYRDRYLTQREGQGTSTVLLDVRQLRAAVRYVNQQGARLGMPPTLRMKVHKSYNHHTPPAADVERVLADLSQPWHRAALCMLWGTGARIGDLGALTWSHIGPHTITIPEGTKTGSRTIPISPRAQQGIDILRQHHPGIGGEGIWPVRRLAASLRWALYRSCDRLGVVRFSPHGLRRLAVDEMRRAGVALEVAAAITGHSPTTMLKHYRTVDPLEVTAAMERAQLGEVPAGVVVNLDTRREKG